MGNLFLGGLSMEKTVRSKKKQSVRWMVQVAILSALATVIMLAEFKLPFIGPDFLKFDFSEVPVMIGAFALGPIAGIAIEGLKVLLNFLLNGTITGGIGELANFLIGVAFVFPASLLYRLHKTKKMALIGLAAGIVCMTVTGALLNYFVLLPLYAGLFHISMEDLILGSSVMIPYITDVQTGILFGIVPFNLFKSIVVSVIVLLLYKRVSPLLKGHDEEPESKNTAEK
jgi:riboflavin transporter FmnP